MAVFTFQDSHCCYAGSSCSQKVSVLRQVLVSMERKLKLPLLLSMLTNIILMIWMINLETTTEVSWKRDHVSSLRRSSSPLLDFSSCQMISHGGKNYITNTTSLQSFASILKTILPLPGQFDPDYKNPCWHMYLSIPTKVYKMFHKHSHLKLSDRDASSIMSRMFQLSPEKSLVCIPQVYFIGFPRSGSTQLYKMLVKHPQIKGGHNKEPHWWTKSQYTSKFPHDVINIIQYLSHFEPAVEYVKSNRDTLVIDASQSTIWDTRNTGNLCFLPKLLPEVVPGAKFIVLMRNPIHRLYSDFSYLCEEYLKNTGGEGYTNTTGMFHESVVREVEGLNTCLEKSSLEECAHYLLSGKILSDKISGCGRVRLGISLYHVHIRRWLKEIPKEQFLFLRTDELAQDPLQVLKKTWKFLDVAEQSVSELEDILHEHLHSTSHAAPHSVSQAVGIRPQTEEILRKLFHPHNNALAELVGDDSFKWT